MLCMEAADLPRLADRHLGEADIAPLHHFYKLSTVVQICSKDEFEIGRTGERKGRTTWEPERMQCAWRRVSC